MNIVHLGQRTCPLGQRTCPLGQRTCPLGQKTCHQNQLFEWYRGDNNSISCSFSWGSCWRRPKMHSSSKYYEKRQKTVNKSENFGPKNCSRVETWNVGNGLKRVVPKFEADRSYVWGVNGRLKFTRWRRYPWNGRNNTNSRSCYIPCFLHTLWALVI